VQIWKRVNFENVENYFVGNKRPFHNSFAFVKLKVAVVIPYSFPVEIFLPSVAILACPKIASPLVICQNKNFMAKTITQRIVFSNVAAATLYHTYVDAKEHSAATGVDAKIQNKEGTRFNAHDGYITGKNFQLIKNRLIVQSWRASDWNKSDPDSTFILLFEQQGKHGIINMVHANVPDKHAAGIKKGWNDYYWKPWKKYFAEKQK